MNHRIHLQILTRLIGHIIIYELIENHNTKAISLNLTNFILILNNYFNYFYCGRLC